MTKTIAKILVAGTLTLVTSSAAWSQNMIPQGDFEPPVVAPILPAGMSVGATGVSDPAVVVTPWRTVVDPTFGSTQAGAVTADFTSVVAPGGQSAFQDLVVSPTTTPFQTGVTYVVFFDAVKDYASTGQLRLTFNGASVQSSSPTLSNFANTSLATLSNTPESYFVRFIATSTSALTFRGFINGTNASPLSSILIDNISIVAVVPEVNGKAAAMPFALMLGALLLAYDSRRKSARVGICH